MNILKLNKISSIANKEFPASYTLTDACENPDGIILRSFKMHDYNLPESLLCVARAGAGVNNIPLDKCAEKGVVVFNTPGANANAVKELVLNALFMCGRKIYEGMQFAQSLANSEDVGKAVEDGKKAFVGGEIMGKTLGVVGLGAIGMKVALAAAALGMKVYGYDPHVSDEKKAALNGLVTLASQEEIFSTCKFITLHVPYLDSTKYMVNKNSIATMVDGVSIINCARGELVNNEDIIAAIKSGKVNKYFTDFPSKDVLGVENIVATPHLGASTPEAEDNCAEMAAKQMVDYIENGNIVNSVNFPVLSKPRTAAKRVCILYKSDLDIAKVLGNCTAKAECRTRGAYGYAIIDTDKVCDCIADIEKTAGVLKVRVLG